MSNHPLKLGIIGGALDSAIGRTHHIASQMDARWRIAAGCFSPSSDTNLATAAALGIPSEHNFSDWRTFLDAERGQVDAILLLTPTPMHAEMAKEALKHGFPVISEKALATTVGEVRAIRAVQAERRGFLTVTYNYTGYPMVRELRAIVASQRLGRLLHLQVEMPQEGFLRLDAQGEKLQPQAWRLQDGVIPTVSLDLGVHVHHLVYFLTGSMPLEVVATEKTKGHFEGIVDNVQCLARYSGDLDAQIWYGKAALGYANGLRIRLFGSLGSAEWHQMNPEYLFLHDSRGGTTQLTRACAGVTICNEERYTRFKAGHPAGFLEAFANLYADFADALTVHLEGGQDANPLVADAASAEEGLRMMEAIALSSRTRTWQPVTPASA